MLETVKAICAIVAIVGGVTAILDMMMNGAAYADWAPFGLSLAAICGFIAIAI